MRWLTVLECGAQGELELARGVGVGQAGDRAQEGRERCSTVAVDRVYLDRIQVVAHVEHLTPHIERDPLRHVNALGDREIYVGLHRSTEGIAAEARWAVDGVAVPVIVDTRERIRRQPGAEDGHSGKLHVKRKEDD